MVTNWDTQNVFHHFIYTTLLVAGNCDIWKLQRGGHLDINTYYVYYVCVRTQIHHVKISLLLLEMLGNIFCSVCRNCKPFAPPRPACSTAVLQGGNTPGDGRSKLLRARKNNQIKQ